MSENIWGFEQLSFREIIGHKRPLEILSKAMISGRVAHCYLFTGPDGVGKRTVAMKFAKAILCGKEKGDSCDQCSSCLKVENSNHPDLLLLEPKGGQILVDQVREIRERLLFRPLESKTRVVIMDNAHDLTPQASNAFLKILEEPPMGNIFVLVASSEASLLPTVVSRCQRIYFGPLMDHEVATFLVHRLAWEEERANEVARQARGSISTALEMADKPLEIWKGEAAEIVDMGVHDQYSSILHLAAKWSNERKEAMERLECLRTTIRETLVEVVGKKSGERPSDVIQARRLEELLWLWRETSKTIEALQRNVNVQLALEELFLAFREMKSSRSWNFYLPWIRRT